MKKCTKCKIEYPENMKYFYKQKGGKNNLTSRCIKCDKERSQLYHRKNAININSRHKINRETNWGKVREIEKQSVKKYKGKRYRETYLWQKKMLKNNIQARLSLNMANCIRQSLKQNKNGRSWEILIGYTLNNLKEYIEKQFQIGMSWNNWGKYGWHIDHIIPISLWQFEKSEDREFKQCWALANLQPLWAEDNLKKGIKIL